MCMCKTWCLRPALCSWLSEGGMVHKSDIMNIITLLTAWQTGKHWLFYLPCSEAVSRATSSTHHLRHLLSVDNSFPRAHITVGILRIGGFNGYYWCCGKVAPHRPYSGMLSQIQSKLCWGRQTSWRWDIGNIVVQNGWGGWTRPVNVYCTSSGDCGWEYEWQ